MDTLPSAVSLARALLSLSRSRQTGVLHVISEVGVCRLAIVEGVPRAASGPPGLQEPLGDALMREGELDPEAHAAALRASARMHGPVGHWLVDAGLVSRPALELALRRQLRDRVLHMFARHSSEYRFAPGEADVGAPLIEEPVCTADLVLAALRAQVACWPQKRLVEAIESGELRLNALGDMLTRQAALWPEEAAAVALLAQGASIERVLRATGGAVRAMRFVAALSLLSALTAAKGRTQRFSLLVRKREELRRAASARALLDLPSDAQPELAGRALRRLACSLHPDALGPEAPDALRCASNEVLRGLADAARELRSEAVRARPRSS